MSRFELSRDAELDLDEIDLKTIELFGFDQADRTDRALHDALAMLADNPGVGHRREDLTPARRDLRFWTVLRRFMVVYLPKPGGIFVVRIVNASKDPRHFLDTGRE